MSQQDIDIEFKPDSTKLRLLKFSTPVIIINSNTYSYGEDGLLGTLSVGDNITNISFSTYSVDINGNEIDLAMDDYYYDISYSLIPNTSAIPSGSSFVNYPINNVTTNYGSAVISGTVTTLSSSIMEFLVRASLSMYSTDGTLIRTDNTDLYCYFNCNLLDSTFYWNADWLEEYTEINGVYNFGSYPRGSVLSIPTELDNTDLYPVTYSFVSNPNYSNPNNYTIPEGIHIDSSGNITGSIYAANTPGDYYFNISAYDSSTNNYGNPDTRLTTFSITVTSSIIVDSSNSTLITWNTNSGSLGSMYEGYDSIFSVSAYSSDGTTISYSLSPNSTQLPGSLYVDNTTGMIMGICPFVTNNTTYSFQIRASNGTVYSDRIFTITILSFFENTNIFGLEIPVSGTLRMDLENFVWDSSIIDDSYIYRNGDSNFGRSLDMGIYLVDGLQNTLDNIGYWDSTLSSSDPYYGIGQDLPSSDTLYSNYQSCLLDKLRNYHHPFSIQITGINYSKVYSPSSDYICDVIYLTIDDVYGSPSGFDSNQNEVLVTDTKISSYKSDIIPWNMTSGDTRVFPASISNCRNDLIQTTNRINTPTYMIRPNAKSGIGLYNGVEPFPLWMIEPTIPGDNTSILGYTPAIVLMYVTPGNGNLAVVNMEQNNISQFFGQIINVDRYIINTVSKTEIHFDLDTKTNTETTFDCYSVDGSIETDSGTWLDVSESITSNVIKFPPGDNYDI